MFCSSQPSSSSSSVSPENAEWRRREEDRHVGVRHLHTGREGQGADIAELPRRRRAQRHREVHAAADGEGGRGLADAAAADRRVHVHVHQMQQPVRGVDDQEERQHHAGVRVPAQDRASHERVLQGDRGGEHTRQLRRHIRAAGRAARLRVPADHRQQDTAGVHHAGRPQAGDPAQDPDGRHQRRVLALRGAQVQEERGVPGRHRVGEPVGQRQRQRAEERDRGLHQNESVSVRHAGTAVGPQRQGAV